MRRLIITARGLWIAEPLIMKAISVAIFKL
jgi:hypothetical protein